MRLTAVYGAAMALLAAGVCVRAAPNSPQNAPGSSTRTTVDRIRSTGVLTCGGAPRPGLAAMDSGGHWSGLEVEICRAVATAVFGASARTSWRSYETDVDFESVRAGADRLSFLTFSELAQHGLADHVLPGPTVFAESYDLLVAAASPAQRLEDLAGQEICFIIGTGAENSLESWFHDHKLEFMPRAFQEDDEMYDTFAVQRCKAMAGESTTLAAARRQPGVNGLVSRLLPDHLAAVPIVVATPLNEDAQWAAIVAWTVATLVNADRKQTPDRPAGLQAMSVDGAGLGLAPGWQKSVVAAVGSYSAMFRRTLGDGSTLKLSPGLNQLQSEGGIFLPPHRN